MLTRSIRSAGEPRVASRWLLRVVNLLQGTGPEGEMALRSMQERGAARLALARALERPEESPHPVLPPQPRPPVAARPRRLTATQVERLLKDPYSVYAERVLGLRPLEPLDAEPDARLRGTFVHDALACYLRDQSALPAEWEALRCGLESALATTAASWSGLAWTRHWPWLGDQWRERVLAVSRWLAETHNGLFRNGWRPTALEASGMIRLQAPCGPFDIVARPDRVDVRDAACRLYDYKTGDPPHLAREIGEYRWGGDEESQQGWAWQLGIGALIAAEGGFEGLQPLQVDGAEYVGLRESARAGEGSIVDAFGNHPSPEQGLNAMRTALLDLVAAYDDPNRSYPAWAIPNSRNPRWANPFDHLSRFAEWAAGGGGTGESDG